MLILRSPHDEAGGGNAQASSPLNEAGLSDASVRGSVPIGYDASSVRRQILDSFGNLFATWTSQFKRDYDLDVRFFVEGAMKCGHFTGPKQSDNPQRKGMLFEEIDVSLRFPKYRSPSEPESGAGFQESHLIDPHDPRLIEIVSRVTSASHSGNFEQNGWRVPAHLSLFHGYYPMNFHNADGSQLREVEMELCVQRAVETCELSDYWDRLFTAEERVEQRKQREILRENPDQLSALKYAQCEGAKFRLLYYFISKGEQAPDIVKPFLSKWHTFAPDQPPSQAAEPWVHEAWQLARRLLVEDRSRLTGVSRWSTEGFAET